MKRNLKTGLVLLFILGLVALFALPDYRNGEASLGASTLYVFRKSPKDFELTLNGKKTRLSDFRGKVVILNFWATWCPPCVDEAPALNALQQHISPLGGVILGVSVDDDQAAYEDFLQKYNISFPTYRDPTHRIALDYGSTMFPETYVIDRDGRFNRKIIGPQDWASPAMTAYLDAVLQEK
jgi:cytochrome c biogenesis protein CcmG, thiol:disulfide interchange protein DsbE